MQVRMPEAADAKSAELVTPNDTAAVVRRDFRRLHLLTDTASTAPIPTGVADVISVDKHIKNGVNNPGHGEGTR